MKHLRSRAVAVIMTLAMALSLTGVAFAASFTDMPADDHWSHAALTAAVENNLLGGKEDNRLDPEGELTRAEMAAIIVRAFQAANEASLAGFIDVSAEEWFYADVAKANQMGVMTGDGNQMKPYDSITREEAFTVLARALKLTDGSASALNAFTDGADVSFWAVGPVAAMVEAGYVKGSDGVLSPAATITRAEFAQTMYNIFGTYLTAEGTYTEVGSGSVMINADGVTLKDVTVHGDVVIGDGVGEGDVTLDNVTVEGRVVVRGGGVNSVHILRSRVSTVVVSKVLGNVRVVGDKSSTVSTVSVTAGTETVVIENIVVTTVDVASTTPVEVKNATVTTVNVAVANANVALTENTTVATVAVASTAVNTTVTTEAGVTVTTVSTDVAVTVTGDGKVNNTTGDGAVTDGEGNAVGTPSTPSTGTGSIGGGGSTGGTTKPPADSTTGTPGDAATDNRDETTPDPTPDDEIPDKAEQDVPDADDTKTEGVTVPDGKTACTGTHTWDTGTVTDATCTVDGSVKYTCTVDTCGAYYTEKIEMLGHNYYVSASSPATCTTDGSKTEKCANCDDEKTTKTANATGHDFENGRADYNETVHYTLCKYCTVKNPENGTAHNFTYSNKTAEKHTMKCDCGYTKTVDHTWDQGKVTAEATCAKDGVKTYTCTACEQTKTEKIDKATVAHTWNEDKSGVCTVCKAVCDHKESETEDACSICGKVLKNEGGETPSHTQHTWADNGHNGWVPVEGGNTHTRTCTVKDCGLANPTETGNCDTSGTGNSCSVCGREGASQPQTCNCGETCGNWKDGKCGCGAPADKCDCTDPNATEDPVCTCADTDQNGKCDANEAEAGSCKETCPVCNPESQD